MAKIQTLPVTLANQIAAGEVVENPASVIKELVENAIDANSTKIDVQIKDGGMAEISVIDNGVGILAEDVEVAFKRHATSKIATQNDLVKVKTLGFRGEALPAIASVTKLELVTATESASQGTEIRIAGGDIEEVKPASARQGTAVTVTDLFYNTPARLKHIKSLNAEAARIIDLMNRFALGHPEISFQLQKDQNLLLKTPGNNNLQQVIASIYGLEIAKKMLKIQGENLDYSINGYISLPEVTRASRKYITLIVNGRYVKNQRINQAIIEGYGSKLMVGRFPIVVLNLNFDPVLVDVNVHPTKQEIRLSKEDELVDLIVKTIKEELAKQNLIPDAFETTLHKSKKQQRNEQLAMDFTSEVAEEESLYQAQQDILAKLNNTEISSEQKERLADFALDAAYNDPFEEDKEITKNDDVEQPEIIEYQAIQTQDEEGATLSDYLKLASKASHQRTTERFPHLEYFGQMHGTYLFAQNETGMYIIDQHAAQERIKYEEYRVSIGKVDNSQQQLLLPIILNFSTDEALKIASAIEELQELGIYLENFGQNSYIIHTHPTWIEENIAETIQELIELYLLNPKMSIATFREATAIMMSCKRSIKANHHLNDMQARQLLADLAKCENPFNCPHGRPVLVHLTNTDMEKMFKRIQDPH